MADSPEDLHELVVELIEEDLVRRRKKKELILEPDYKGKFNGQILIRTEIRRRRTPVRYGCSKGVKTTERNRLVSVVG